MSKTLSRALLSVVLATSGTVGCASVSDAPSESSAAAVTSDPLKCAERANVQRAVAYNTFCQITECKPGWANLDHDHDDFSSNDPKGTGCETDLYGRDNNINDGDGHNPWMGSVGEGQSARAEGRGRTNIHVLISEWSWKKEPTYARITLRAEATMGYSFSISKSGTRGGCTTDQVAVMTPAPIIPGPAISTSSVIVEIPDHWAALDGSTNDGAMLEIYVYPGNASAANSEKFDFVVESLKKEDFRTNETVCQINDE